MKLLVVNGWMDGPSLVTCKKQLATRGTISYKIYVYSSRLVYCWLHIMKMTRFLECSVFISFLFQLISFVFYFISFVDKLNLYGFLIVWSCPARSHWCMMPIKLMTV